MTKQLDIGDILELSTGKRMVYRGDGIATMELFYPERSVIGGLTNSGKGEWKQAEYTKTMALTAQQITFWLSKK